MKKTSNNNKFATPGRFLHIAAAMTAVAISTNSHAALVGHWEFDGGFTATVGTGATAQGGASLGTDRNGNPNSALSTAGPPQYASVADGGGLNNLESGTIAFWVQWNGSQDPGFGGTFGGVTSRQDNGVSSEQLITLNGADPAASVITWRPYDAFTNAVTGSTPVGNGVWRHVAITYTSGSHILYLDGNVDGIGNLAAPVGGITDKPAVALGIGAWYGDGNAFSTALIDDFRVYDTVLTQSEVQAVMNIPEPTASALALLGVLGFAGFRRRR